MKQNWTEAEKFDNCFCVICDCYLKNFVSGKKNGHEALSPPNLDFFLIFPNLLRSSVLSCSATREATRA